MVEWLQGSWDGTQSFVYWEFPPCPSLEGPAPKLTLLLEDPLAWVNLPLGSPLWGVGGMTP